MGYLAASMKCNACGNKSLMSDMRYSRFSDSLVCVHCYEAQKKAGVKGALKAAQRKAAPPEGDSFVKYKCGACGYRFSRKQSVDFGRVCPYCSRDSAVRVSLNEAQQLLRESRFVGYY
ncbi:MAG: hypothetical protein HY518_01840 [Candidatus Aenigmarchaeota archaeon]|nr:hypothetical protein [Candidatus Aenigmarchaeota archaeon]